MRFVFAVHGWYVGGFATFCRNLSEGLRDRGHEVILLVLPETGLKAHPPSESFDRCVVLPRALRRLRTHVQQVAQTIDQLHPDVLVLNDSPYAMAALPLIRYSIVRLPVIHSVAPEEVKLGLSQGPWCDRVVVVSEFVQRAVTAPERVAVCPLGVPIPASPQRRGPVAASRKSAAIPQWRPYGEGRGPIELISVGRVVIHQKRMDRVPAVARLLVQNKVGFHWTIVGDGEYLPHLRRELSRLGLAGHFSFKGALAPPAVAAALEAAEVFVLPSDCEGMPQAMLEAMAHGVVPVVSALAGATTRLVTEPQCGYLCQPSEPAEFAAAIAELARRRTLCDELGGRAAEHIGRQFSLDAFTTRFLTVVADARKQAVQRPAPLPNLGALHGESTFRCLSLWRSLRHQSLGQLKRRLLQYWAETFVQPRSWLHAA